MEDTTVYVHNANKYKTNLVHWQIQNESCTVCTTVYVHHANKYRTNQVQNFQCIRFVLYRVTRPCTKLQVSFTEYTLFYRALLQESPVICMQIQNESSALKILHNQNKNPVRWKCFHIITRWRTLKCMYIMRTNTVCQSTVMAPYQA